MINPTEKNVIGFFAFAIQNGKNQLITNLNANGYPTALTISNQSLADKLFDIYMTKGSAEIEKLLAGIRIDKNKFSNADALAVRQVLTGEDPTTANQKSALELFQEIWAGVSNTVGGTSTTTSKPIISPAAAIGITALGVGTVIFLATRP